MNEFDYVFIICLSLLINQTLNILLMKEKLLLNASKKYWSEKKMPYVALKRQKW